MKQKREIFQWNTNFLTSWNKIGVTIIILLWLLATETEANKDYYNWEFIDLYN